MPAEGRGSGSVVGRSVGKAWAPQGSPRVPERLTGQVYKRLAGAVSSTVTELEFEGWFYSFLAIACYLFFLFCL